MEQTIKAFGAGYVTCFQIVNRILKEIFDKDAYQFNQEIRRNDMFKLNLEDVDRLLSEQEAKDFKEMCGDNIEKLLSECDQPPDLGPVSEDKYKLAMLTHIQYQVNGIPRPSTFRQS
jgi:hypothetical protein